MKYQPTNDKLEKKVRNISFKNSNFSLRMKFLRNFYKKINKKKKL